MSNILAIGAASASSSDQTVGTGGLVTLFLSSADGKIPSGCSVAVELKTAGGQYVQQFLLGSDENKRAFNLVAAATTPFRVTRIATGIAVGVEAVGQV